MKDILRKVDHNDGLRTPDGYFDTFAARMEVRLPRLEMEREGAGASHVLHRSVWQRIRPYVYMAAMFMGVWCMMQMFTLIHQSASADPVTQSPALATALGNEQFVGEYLISAGGALDDYEIMESLYEEGASVESLTE